MKSPAAIAIDLGGTKVAAALFDAEGRVLGKQVAPLEKRTGSAVGELILEQVNRLRKAAMRRELNVTAIGICVPGIANPKTGRVWAPNIPGWDDYPLRAEVRKAVADLGARVVVESDRAASILGEAWQGAARGVRDAIFLAVGTGIGAGILVDGKVLQGAHGIAGAIGWLALDRPFQSEYRACGCFESHASGEGIALVAKKVAANRKRYRGPLRRKDVTAELVFEAWNKADEVAIKTLNEAVNFWGMAAANLVSLFNPEKIIFGGGVFGPAVQFLEMIRAEAGRWAQPVAIRRVTFQASALGSDAALYGAAHLALYGRRLPKAAAERKRR